VGKEAGIKKEITTGSLWFFMEVSRKAHRISTILGQGKTVPNILEFRPRKTEYRRMGTHADEDSRTVSILLMSRVWGNGMKRARRGHRGFLTL